MMDTRLGAALTLSMAFIVAILGVSVYSEVNSLETATMVPKNSANLTSADFGSISVRLRAAAFKNSLLPKDQQSCDQISLLDDTPLVKCTQEKAAADDASTASKELLLCSIDLSCKVSNEVTGRPNIKFVFPKSFQAIQWSVKPDKSWNYQQTQVTHVLRAINGVLSGTKTTPSVVDIQMLRGRYDDSRVETKNKINGIQTDYGLQLAWAGSKLVEPEDGGGGGEEDVHYVAFQFDVNPLVLKITAKNIKDQLSLAIAVLALFTTVIAAVKVMKTISQCLIDKIFLLRRGASAPEDVLRRKQVLEEINNVDENNSASSPSQQEEKTSLDKNAGTPKKKRRLSSRELMALQNMHSNPMERLERGRGQPPKEIEMNDTGLTQSKGVSSEIVERMLNDMREEIREEMREEMREEVDLLKSQMSQQQSQAAEQQSQAAEQQSQLKSQMAEMAQVITKMDQERTSASSKPMKQRRATSSHSTSKTVIPLNWVRHVNEDGEEFYELADGSVQWEKPPGNEIVEPTD